MYRQWDKSRPPPGAFTLNRDCEQAQGLVAWWPMGGPGGAAYMADLAGTNHLTGTAIAQSYGPSNEPVAVLNGSSSVYVNSAPVIAAAPMSYAVWVNPTTIASVYGIGEISDAAGADRWQMDVNAGTLRMVSNVGATARIASQSGVAANTWSHCLCVEASSTSRTAYVNGVAGTTNTDSSTPNMAGGRTTVGSLFITSANAFFWPGQLGEAGFWNVDISQHVQRLYSPATRFELWYPLRSSKWFSAGAGGGTTISGNLGTAVASGLTGTVNANRTIAGSLGTASATGLQGSVNANRSIAGALGVAAASGFQGGVVNDNGVTISGNLGVATASGFTGGINANRSILGVCGIAFASGFTGGVQSGEPAPTKIGGDDGFERQRIEVYEPRKKPKKKDEELDTVMKAAFNKVMGREPAPVQVVQPFDDEEDDIEALMLVL